MTMLGERVDAAIRAENFGLNAQRLAAIGARMPRCGWAVEYGDDGMAVRMRWGLIPGKTT